MTYWLTSCILELAGSDRAHEIRAVEPLSGSGWRDGMVVSDLALSSWMSEHCQQEHGGLGTGSEYTCDLMDG